MGIVLQWTVHFDLQTLKLSHFSWDLSRFGSAGEYRYCTVHVRVTLCAPATEKGTQTQGDLFSVTCTE